MASSGYGCTPSLRPRRIDLTCVIQSGFWVAQENARPEQIASCPAPPSRCQGGRMSTCDAGYGTLPDRRSNTAVSVKPWALWAVC